MTVSFQLFGHDILLFPFPYLLIFLVIPVYSALLSNLSATSSSKTFLHEVNARIPGSVTLIHTVSFISKIKFRPVMCPITYW